nr:inhibitor of apoptosis protein [Hymenolepis microstoma]
MFSEFQAALKEVFTVTVQREEELSCPIVTTALACLIQKYAYAPRYATHAQCLASFGASNPSQRLSSTELAAAGFFHTGRADETVCGACFVGLRDWQPCDIDAEAVHAEFSGPGGCLYLTTRRILTSVLPLARKNLPSSKSAFDAAASNVIKDRLAAIAKEMEISDANRCWPIGNARALGYSDDIILLALWRLQTEKSSKDDNWKIDPQGTTDLLKAILRVQESGLGDEDLPEIPDVTLEETSEFSEETSSESTEVAELEAVLSGQNVSPQTHMPCLSQMLQWWAKTWLPRSIPSVTVTYSSSPRSVLRRKANSTSV